MRPGLVPAPIIGRNWCQCRGRGKEGWGSSTTKTNPVLPQSQGPLTTKAPLWVTSSLLPILAPTPPSLLVATNTMVVSKAGKPIYLRRLPAPSLLTRSLWQLYWSKEEEKGKEGDG